jgi:hypothetical protein
MKTIKFICVFIIMTHFAKAQNLNANLVACYPLDCDKATNYAPTGSILNGTIFNVSCANGHTGAPNTAYRFQGNASSYIKLPNNPLLKGSQMSFSGWINFNNTNDNQHIVFTHNGCVSYHEGYTLVVGPNGTGGHQIKLVKSGPACSSLTEPVLLGASNLSPNTWYHVGFYIDNNIMKVYVNGSPDGTFVSSVPLTYDPSADIYLGGTNLSFNKPFNGSMDNVRFYNRQLTDLEFLLLFKNDPRCKTPNVDLLTNLAACYPLDCDVNNYAATGSALDGTVSSGSPIVVCVPGHTSVPNTAYELVLSPSSYLELPNHPLLKASQVSFSGWIRFSSVSADQNVVFTGNGCGSFNEGYNLKISYVGPGAYRLTLIKAGSGCNAVSQSILLGGSIITAGPWYHVGFYIDNNTMEIYLNGNQDASMSSTIPLTYDPSGFVYIGGNPFSPIDVFGGVVDNLRFYDRQLIPSEFMTLYTSDPDCSSPNKPGRVDNENLMEKEQILYPNPTKGKVYFKDKNDETFELYDHKGEKVKYEIVSNEKNISEISILDPRKGIYFIKVLDNTGKYIKTMRFVIEE